MATSAIATMQPEEARLEFQMGNSDKVYNLSLTQCETGWTVAAAWGRRGSTLSADVKIERAEYEAAKRLYDSVLRHKMAKGYQLLAVLEPKRPQSAALTSKRPVSRDCVFSAELLTRITEQEVMLYARSSRHRFEIKRDGVRLTVVGERIPDSKLYEIFGYNKLGQVVQLDARLYAGVRQICDIGHYRRIIMDGEWEASDFWGWDLLELDGDLRGMGASDRRDALAELFRDLPLPELKKLFHVVECADSTEEKLALLAKAKATRCEGIVVKTKNAPYRGGRNGSHMKYKFESTASFIVGPKPKHKANDGHRSIALYVIDNGRERFVSTVKVADRYPLIPEGSVVDARYLYAYPGGGIVQAAYFGVVRKDVRREDCVVQQLRMKQDSEDAA